jgi:hypothetical protein
LIPEASPRTQAMDIPPPWGEVAPLREALSAGIVEAPFERKFLVTEDQATRVAEWASLHLSPDPHAEAGAGGIYRVTSLYLDTDQLDVYHRRGSFGRAKYRLRRYNEAKDLFLERKCKVKGRVRKRRTLLEPEELAWLFAPIRPADWPGRWFARRIELRGLAPTSLVSYRRVARVGEDSYGPIRLTIDRDFLCGPAEGIHVPKLSGGPPVFAGLGVVELKYRTAMPSLFKTLIAEQGLIPAKASKYRAAVQACGLCPADGGGTDA